MSFIREKTYTLPITLARGLRIRARTKRGKKRRRKEKPGGVPTHTRRSLFEQTRTNYLQPGRSCPLRTHLFEHPTGSVRKDCNENRRSQPSKIIANMEITTSKSERGKKKRDDSPRAKAMQLCNRISNRIGQKNQGSIRTHMIVTVETHQFYWKRTMAYHLEKTAQNRLEAPRRRADNESDFGPNGQEEYRGGPAHKHPPTKLYAKRQLDEQKTLPRSLTENHSGLHLDVYKDHEVQHILHNFESFLWNREGKDFSHAIQKTQDSQEYNTTLSPKQVFLVRENSEGKRVYQINFRRNRTQKSDVETMLVCGPLVIRQELNVLED